MRAFHGAKITCMLTALYSLLSFEGISSAGGTDADGSCSAALDKADADAAMRPLFGAFQLVDKAFNSGPAGLSESYIATLGYFVDRTEVIAYGPFQPVGPLGPGALAGIGIAESSHLQAVFEGGLKAAYGPATTLIHAAPIVTVVWKENRRAMVTSFADVFDASNNKVAVVKGLAQYYIPCAPGAVPPIDWIHFTLQVLTAPAH